MATFQSINPATDEVLKEFAYESMDAIEKKLQVLQVNTNWPSMSPKEKAACFKKIAEKLEKNKEKYAKIMTLEMGKPIKQSMSEVEKCAWVCNYFADNAEAFTKIENIKTEFQKSYIRLDPLGVILGVMPWNFPFWQVFRFAIPALLAGNRIVVKHASNVPQCAAKLEEIFQSCLPENTYKNIFVAGRDTAQVIQSPHVAAVSITGSTAAGAKVAEAAGKVIKKVVLELGGSDPFIVLKDADLKEAAKAATIGRFLNTGQSCIAAKRFLVEEAIGEKFLALFAEEVKNLRIGDPMNPETDIGPLARADLRDQLHEIVDKSKQQGAVAVYGGDKVEGKGAFYQPTLLKNVTEDMPIMQEESFGPAAPVFFVKDAEGAVQIANSSEYGLGASIWTKDIVLAEKLAAQIETGFVAINDTVKSDPRLPFGGVKKSGYGRELSHHSVREFANIKTVVVK